MATMAVVAHQGGWDEALFVLVPVAIFGLLLWLANRRAARRLAAYDAAQAAEGAEGAEGEAGPAEAVTVEADAADGEPTPADEGGPAEVTGPAARRDAAG